MSGFAQGALVGGGIGPAPRLGSGGTAEGGGKRDCGGKRVEPGLEDFDRIPPAGVELLAHGAVVPTLGFGKGVAWVAQGALVPG